MVFMLIGEAFVAIFCSVFHNIDEISSLPKIKNQKTEIGRERERTSDILNQEALSRRASKD